MHSCAVMHLTLVLPNLLDAAPAELAAADAPALARLLSIAPAPSLEAGGTIAIACGRLGVERQCDWPVAPWLARAAGVEPGGRYWLCAEPASLEVGRDEVRLAGVVRDLDADENAALLSSLRAHFETDGIEFVERGPGNWWATLALPQQIETSPPEAALGQSLSAYLPRGPDAARWRRWQSEIQMLLFEHPVNRLRESRGRAPVNYVWVWGGGTLNAANPAAPRPAVFTHVPWLREFARAAGAEVSKVPRSLTEFGTASSASSALIWLDGFKMPGLREQLAAFDADWAAPMERALARREIDASLVVGGHATAISLTLRARGMLQRLRHHWSAVPGLAAQLAAFTDA
jgi:hypothetical protein